MKEKVETVNVEPSWKNLVPLFSDWIDGGTQSQKDHVKAELARLAKLADDPRVKAADVLLEACKAALWGLQGHIEQREAIKVLKEAISKAEGGGEQSQKTP